LWRSGNLWVGGDALAGPEFGDESGDGVGGDACAAADVYYFESAVGDELVDSAAARAQYSGGLFDGEQGRSEFRRPRVELVLDGHGRLL
jgi:hypothetical protein